MLSDKNRSPHLHRFHVKMSMFCVQLTWSTKEAGIQLTTFKD